MTAHSRDPCKETLKLYKNVIIVRPENKFDKIKHNNAQDIKMTDVIDINT